MHCGSAGQAKCGGNLARPDRVIFKRAFEIDSTGKTCFLNSLATSRRSRDFAPDRPKIFPALLLNWRSGDPIPKFASAGGILRCELRNQKGRRKSKVLVRSLALKFL